MNFVVLTAALSGANAALYMGSACFFRCPARLGAPARLGRLNNAGSPQYAVLVSSIGILFALAVDLWGSGKCLPLHGGAVFTGMILSWLVSLAAHVSVRRRHSPQQLLALPLRSPLGTWESMLGFALASLALLETWLSPIVNLWSGLSCLLLLVLAYLLARMRKSPSMPVADQA